MPTDKLSGLVQTLVELVVEFEEIWARKKEDLVLTGDSLFILMVNLALKVKDSNLFYEIKIIELFFYDLIKNEGFIFNLVTFMNALIYRIDLAAENERRDTRKMSEIALVFDRPSASEH